MAVWGRVWDWNTEVRRQGMGDKACEIGKLVKRGKKPERQTNTFELNMNAIRRPIQDFFFQFKNIPLQQAFAILDTRLD